MHDLARLTVHSVGAKYHGSGERGAVRAGDYDAGFGCRDVDHFLADMVFLLCFLRKAFEQGLYEFGAMECDGLKAKAVLS